MLAPGVTGLLPAQQAAGIHYLYLMLRTRLDDVRRDDRGASAVEWAVIAGICVALAVVIAGAIKLVVNHGKSQIDQGTTTGP
ncbi:MAG: hypothetical protein ACJ73S_30095 [Mycobacteriales bacterium]|jgi:Flp pilus assembly pilin Flp